MMILARLATVMRNVTTAAGRWSVLLALLLSATTDAMAGPALARGINLSHWFQYTGRQPVLRADLDAIRMAGFDYVRIPFDPAFLGWDPAAGPEMSGIARLRTGVEMALAAGLDVTLDMHPEEGLRQSVEEQRSQEEALARLWTVIARRFADLPVDRLAFELLNEPQYYSGSSYRWNDAQMRLAAAVRAGAPKHLLLATGRKGSSPEGLAELTPLKDPNVAYVFHFYLPYVFTHQSAAWLVGNAHTTAGAFRGLPYPAALIATQPPTINYNVERRRIEKDLAAYQGKEWNTRHLAQLIEPAVAWAKANKVRLICNEFGVLREHADSASRYRWITDVRSTLQGSGIGWAVWDYSDLFGITKGSGATTLQTRRIEPEALSALNLKK